MATRTGKNIWGFSRQSILSRYSGDRASKAQRVAEVIVHSGKKAVVGKEWRDQFHDTASSATALLRMSDSGRVIKILVSPLAVQESETDSRLKTAPAARIRDAMGPLLSALERLEIEHADIQLDLKQDEAEAAIVGLEIALYRFKRVLKNEQPKISLSLRHKGKVLNAKALEAATVLGQAVNVARHLVNLPPNELNPVTYAGFVQTFMTGLKGVKVDVWDEKRLRQEGMNLHAGVGQGSNSPPRLIHIRYRPSAAGKKAPVAFVGKGITFDTGGLDIKPSSGMRLMKKDMGGSASVLGLAYWAVRAGVKAPLDFYIATAENSVSGEAFRPSDVLTARNGMSVEIHNTDAEGRLVLADALDVAVTAKEKPRAVIDVATLTGAIKVALGSGMAGVFCNDVKLASTLVQAGYEMGDLAWPMPLFQKYRSSMNSNFADMVNATDGFGGAVTAALFLEKFVRDVPWAHFDIYAWKDSAEGCWLEGGGSGQSVMGLANWLRKV
jgi:leucyl aminopeptidase